MASIKRLKKDIDYLTFAVIADCFNYNSYCPGNPDVLNIIKEMVSTRNDLRARINKVEVKDSSEIKGYYKGILNDLVSKADNSFSTLSEIVKKEK